MTQQTTSLIFMVLIFVVFWFMLIRPQKKKEKEIRNMRSSLKVGDEVITIGGLHGKIVKANDEIVVLELDHAKQRLTFSKWAIGSTTEKTAEKNKQVEEIEGKTDKE